MNEFLDGFIDIRYNRNPFSKIQALDAAPAHPISTFCQSKRFNSPKKCYQN